MQDFNIELSFLNRIDEFLVGVYKNMLGEVAFKNIEEHS